MDHFLEQGEEGLSGAGIARRVRAVPARRPPRAGLFRLRAHRRGREGIAGSLIEKLLPNPKEGNPPPFVKGTGAAATPIQAVPDPKQHVIADVFKIVNDPFVGKLSACSASIRAR